MGVKTFRPGFREHLHQWERTPMDERGHAQEATPVKTPQTPGRTAPGCAATRGMGGRQLRQHGQRQGGFGSASDADDPQRGERHGQPEPFGAARVGHLGLFPAPPPALEVFGAAFDPGPQAVPGHVGDGGRQIGQHQPGVCVARIPACHQGTCQLALRGGQAAHRPLPAAAGRRRRLAEQTNGGGAIGAIRPLAIDPQEGMPAPCGDGLKEPFGVQAPPNPPAGGLGG